MIRVGGQVRDLYVVVGDPRKLVKVLEILSYFGLAVRGLSPEVRCVQGVVVVDDEGYTYIVKNGVAVDGRLVNIDDHGLDKGLAMAIVYARVLQVNPIHRIVVGIDYGKNIGMAVVVNDDVVHIRSYRSADKALKDAKFFLENVESEFKIVRLGIANEIDEEFVDAVVEMFRDVSTIEFVPEFRSSRHRYFLEDARLSPDEVAAINIAFYRDTEGR